MLFTLRVVQYLVLLGVCVFEWVPLSQKWSLLDRVVCFPQKVTEEEEEKKLARAHLRNVHLMCPVVNKTRECIVWAMLQWFRLAGSTLRHTHTLIHTQRTNTDDIHSVYSQPRFFLRFVHLFSVNVYTNFMIFDRMISYHNNSIPLKIQTPLNFQTNAFFRILWSF